MKSRILSWEGSVPGGVSVDGDWNNLEAYFLICPEIEAGTSAGAVSHNI